MKTGVRPYGHGVGVTMVWVWPWCDHMAMVWVCDHDHAVDSSEEVTFGKGIKVSQLKACYEPLKIHIAEAMQCYISVEPMQTVKSPGHQCPHASYPTTKMTVL